MHILFLTDNFVPEVNAPASRTYEHCREWVKAGHRVTVITCVPNFPKGIVFPGYRNRLWQEEWIDGIRVVRVWTYITANEGFLRRTLDYASFMVSSVVAAGFVDGVDVVVGTSPQFFTACAAYLVSAVKRRPFVFELRDLWPESIVAVGAMRQPWLLRGLDRLALFLYRRAAAIIPLTYAFAQTLRLRGIDATKIHVVTNGVDLVRFRPTAKDERLVGTLGLQGCFVLGYIGTHGLAHGLETLLEAADLLRRRPGGDRFRVLFVGDGAKKRALIAEARRRELGNVIWIDTVSKEDIPRYWSVLDAAVIHLQPEPLFQTVIPSKLFEAMAMGVPVLHGVNGESAQLVEREGVGIVFRSGHASALVEAAIRLATDPGLCATCRRNAREAATRYDRRRLAQEMLQVLEAVVLGRQGTTQAHSTPDAAAP